MVETLVKEEAMIDTEKCKKCIHGDGEGNCVTKQEAPFDSFICENNEEFEKV